jgi:hypothetical protein
MLWIRISGLGYIMAHGDIGGSMREGLTIKKEFYPLRIV